MANSPQICPNRGSFYFLANWGNFQATKEREGERDKEGEHEKKAMQDACVDAAPLALSLSLSLWGLFCSLHVRFFTCVLFALCHSTVICRLLHCTHTDVRIPSQVCMYVCVIVNGHRAALAGKCEGYTTRSSSSSVCIALHIYRHHQK